METIEKIVDRNWFQLTDGNQTAFIQIFGNSDVCCSDDMPEKDHAAHRFMNRDLNVTPPDKVWIRAAGDEGKIRIVIS